MKRKKLQKTMKPKRMKAGDQARYLERGEGKPGENTGELKERTGQ